MEMKNTLDSEIKMLEKEYEMLNKEYELWADVQSCLDLHQPELGEKTDVHYSYKTLEKRNVSVVYTWDGFDNFKVTLMVGMGDHDETITIENKLPVLPYRLYQEVMIRRSRAFRESRHVKMTASVLRLKKRGE